MHAVLAHKRSVRTPAGARKASDRARWLRMERVRLPFAANGERGHGGPPPACWVADRRAGAAGKGVNRTGHGGGQGGALFPNVTLGTYSHYMPGQQASAVQSVARFSRKRAR